MNDWIDLCDDKDVKARATMIDRIKKIFFYTVCIVLFVCEYEIMLHCRESAGVCGVIVLALFLVVYNAGASHIECLKGAMCASIWFNNHQRAMIERRFDKVVEVPRVNYFTYKGVVGTMNLLYSIKDQLIGDVYYVISADAEYYWDGHDWKDIKEHLHVPYEEQNKVDYRKITGLDGDCKGPRG